MRTGIIAVYLIFLYSVVSAQVFPSELWHEGKLVLVSEDTLKGKLKYDFVKDLVQIEVDGRTLTYSTKNIFYFEIFDVTSESYREFYVLPYGLVSSYKTPTIFEVLVEGSLTLLSREYIMTKHIQNPYSYGSYTQEVLAYDYFFLDRRGNITKYTMKKKDLYEVLAKRRSQIDEYIKANRLHHDRRNDLVRIISFYNALL
jgi:hypothetical protein